jgi:hypothetical protein
MRGRALALMGLAAACAHGPFARAIRECPGPLVPTQELGADFLARERIEIETEGHSVRLDIAIQKRGDELAVVGFDPVGPKLFQVVQRGTQLEVEALPGRVLKVSPENVVRDVHRVRFLGIEMPPGGSGEVVAMRDGARISETWHGGQLLARRIEPAGGERAVMVEFPPQAGGAIAIRAEGCGYQARVTPVSERALP